MFVNFISRSNLLLAASLIFVVLLSVGFPAPVSAQCGIGKVTSSCENCHQQQPLSFSQDAWHITHAGKSACIDCHGGNATVKEKEKAHLGVFGNPLADIYTNCHACHPSDYVERASSYAETLHFTLAGFVTPAGHQQVSAHQPTNEIVVQTDDAKPLFSLGKLTNSMVASGGIVILLIIVLLAFINLRHPAG